jgi:hypothetical protein
VSPELVPELRVPGTAEALNKQSIQEVTVTIYQLIELLSAKDIHFTLSSHREEAIMATASIPGQLWEIEVFQDGSVEMEIFRSHGELYDEGRLVKEISALED